LKIVLREHVEHLGDRGEIVSVAAGYARNYLIPKRLAVEATPGNLKVIEQQRRVFALKEAREVGEAEKMAERLAAIELSVTKKAGESGTLYGSVTTSEIAEMLVSAGVEVDRRRIHLTEPIKSLGDYEIPIKVYRQISGTIKLHVVTEAAREPTLIDTRPEPSDLEEDFDE
jgi:large subunit ribosomal protein L9